MNKTITDLEFEAILRSTKDRFKDENYVINIERLRVYDEIVNRLYMLFSAKGLNDFEVTTFKTSTAGWAIYYFDKLSLSRKDIKTIIDTIGVSSGISFGTLKNQVVLSIAIPGVRERIA